METPNISAPESIFDSNAQEYNLTISDAQKIIRQHQLSAPVQTVALAKSFGIKVFKIDIQDKNFSGMIRKEDSGKFHIYVKKSHPENRRRFTIAHEIGHFILHRDIMGNGVYDDAMYRSGLPSLKETEANQMAADILMPWHLLSDDVANFNGADMVAELAKKYQVSAQSMSIRLSGLNLRHNMKQRYI